MGWFRFSYRLILLPSFAGLACYACKPVANTTPNHPSTPLAIESAALSELDSELNSEPASGLDKKPTTITAKETLNDAAILPTAAAQPAVSISASSAAYEEGINLASSAHVLSQSALSPDDWGLIASRWERAAAQLKKVAPQDTRYEQAQQKANEYTLNAEAANAQITQLQTPVYVPLARNNRQATAPTTRQTANTQGTQARLVDPELITTQIPIVRRMHGTPIVRVTFNHGRTYEMILDTGASRTLITRQMAQDLGVVVTESMMAATASQAEVSFDIGQVDAISMGGITLENANVTIGDAVNIGLLGNDFLQGYDVTIRAHTGVVELSKSN